MGSKLTESQRRALQVLIDTFMPALGDEDAKAVLADPDLEASAWSATRTAAAKRVLGTSGSELGVSGAMEELLGKGVLQREEDVSLRLVLELLSSAAGTALLCTANPLKGAFTHRSPLDREALLLRLSTRCVRTLSLLPV